MIYGEVLARMLSLHERGYRFCHNRSAAKHRMRGHDVRCIGSGWYAWKSEGATP